jgi:hypothetical protein
MVTRLDNTGGSVEIEDVLVGGRIAKEDACKVMMIKFGALWSRSFNAHAGPERFQAGNVRFMAMPSFEWGLVSHGVDEPVM